MQGCASHLPDTFSLASPEVPDAQVNWARCPGSVEITCALSHTGAARATTSGALVLQLTIFYVLPGGAI
jgi:hypothetical protein